MTAFTPPHCGLTISRDQIDRARADRSAEPFPAAWDVLKQRQPPGLEAVLMNAFRFAFDLDRAAGEFALIAAQTALAAGLSSQQPPFEALEHTVLLTQALELLRDHPANTPSVRAEAHAALIARVEGLAVDPRLDTLPEKLWWQTAQMAVGIAAERADWVNSAASAFRQTILTAIRPQGFIAAAVKGEDGGGLYRQIISAAALVMQAEMAAQIGLDLWSHTVRGVSVMTTALYPIYYFYTTEKWKWDPGLKVEPVQDIFRRYGGYLELMQFRYPHRDIRTVLADLRPVWSPSVGGLTTLSHGRPEAKTKRGWFPFGRS